MTIASIYFIVRKAWSVVSNLVRIVTNAWSILPFLSIFGMIPICVDVG